MASKKQLEVEEQIYNMALAMIRREIDVSDWNLAQIVLRDDIVPFMKNAHPSISLARIGHQVFRAGLIVHGEHVRKMEANQ